MITVNPTRCEGCRYLRGIVKDGYIIRDGCAKLGQTITDSMSNEICKHYICDREVSE